MELRQLAVVVAVAEEGGFTAAAQRLRTVQSTVSTVVRALERDLGTPLFHRTTHRVVLTPAGEAFVPAARAALEAAEHARAVVSPVAGCVRVGVCPGMLADLHRVLVKLRDAHPGLAVEVRRLPAGEAGCAVAESTVDLAVTAISGGPAAAHRPDLGAERGLVPAVGAGSAPAASPAPAIRDTTAARQAATYHPGLGAAGNPAPATDTTPTAARTPAPMTDRTTPATAGNPTPTTDITSAAARNPAPTTRTTPTAARNPAPMTDRTTPATAGDPAPTTDTTPADPGGAAGVFPGTGLVTTPLAAEELVLATAPGGSRSAPVDLSGLALVDFPLGWAIREAVDRAFPRRRVTVEVDDLATAAGIVRAGLAACVLPASAAARFPELTVRRFDRPPPWQLAAVHRSPAGAAVGVVLRQL
ncbi:LysR family transcriptional regulator [Amycolatopsis sp. cg9]|uniref:LysR family transcriptional regulator n=3 Tax=Amycolatopsis TaxID=1813 RepID=UPI0035249DAA